MNPNRFLTEKITEANTRLLKEVSVSTEDLENLRKEFRDLLVLKFEYQDSWEQFHDKLYWTQERCLPRELGMHLADVVTSRHLAMEGRIAKMETALRDMAQEFRELDLPYGSKAYAQAIEILNKPLDFLKGKP